MVPRQEWPQDPQMSHPVSLEICWSEGVLGGEGGCHTRGKIPYFARP